MSITVKPTTTEVDAEVGGKTVKVYIDRYDGSLRTRVAGKDITGYTLANLRAQAEAAIASAAEKREALKAARAAEKSPDAVLAVLAATGEQVKVRGADKRNDRALVTRADGSKESMAWDSLLRLLSEDEAATFEALLARAAEAAKAAKEAAGASRYELSRALEGLVYARFDPEQDAWVAEHDGVEYTGGSLSTLRANITDDIIAREYPYLVTHDGVIARTEGADQTSGTLFRTEDDAECYAWAARAGRNTNKERWEFIRTHRFDHVPFID